MSTPSTTVPSHVSHSPPLPLLLPPPAPGHPPLTPPLAQGLSERSREVEDRRIQFLGLVFNFLVTAFVGAAIGGMDFNVDIETIKARCESL